MPRIPIVRPTGLAVSEIVGHTYVACVLPIGRAYNERDLDLRAVSPIMFKGNTASESLRKTHLMKMFTKILLHFRARFGTVELSEKRNI